MEQRIFLFNFFKTFRNVLASLDLLVKKDSILAILARKFKVFEKYLVAFSVCMFGGKEGACTGWLPADFIQNQSAIKDVNYGNGNGDMT